eukprot:CAMPEP_0115621812 /NCGR_PEP_ID=MMETSP0272-20121206/25924_1 /TAXON_ID=71861 /ORGANISM="Scrippsiella trochoidea, Strain CCMP3099" /LENGTH=409 /DNA_ID=CAMNT_0003057953 /DNA_START=530 /DNA_END=1756 /DNA_ORIENTATION=+
MLRAHPAKAEPHEDAPQDAEADRNDPLVGFHCLVFADQHADDQTGNGPPHVGSVALATIVGGKGIGEYVDGDKCKDHEDSGQAELLLVPIHDNVCDVDADQRVAPAGAAHHGSVRIGPHIAASPAEDAYVEHERQAPPSMHALQGYAEHKIQEDVHAHVRGANMGELVREPAPNLCTVVLARRAIEAQVEHALDDRVQATLRIEDGGTVLVAHDDRHDQPQSQDGHTLEDYEPRISFALHHFFHRLELLGFALHLAVDQVVDVHVAIAVPVQPIMFTPSGGLLLRLLLFSLSLGQDLLPNLGALLGGALLRKGDLVLVVEQALLGEPELDILSVEVTVAVLVEMAGIEPDRKEENRIVEYIRSPMEFFLRVFAGLVISVGHIGFPICEPSESPVPKGFEALHSRRAGLN